MMTALTAFFLLSCSFFCSALPTDVSTIKWVDCAQHVPWTLNTTDIDLENLPSTLKCGRLVVPMDYEKPIGAKNNITLGLAMYRPRNPKGVIFQYGTLTYHKLLSLIPSIVTMEAQMKRPSMLGKQRLT